MRRVTKIDLLNRIRMIRALFGSLDLDVSRYTDEAIAEAFLAVAPVLDASWPKDGQVRAVYRHLIGKSA